MVHGQRQDGQEVCHRVLSTPMDIPDQETRRSYESIIGLPLRPLNLPFFLAPTTPLLGMILGTCDWSPLWEARSRVQRRCHLSHLPILGPPVIWCCWVGAIPPRERSQISTPKRSRWRPGVGRRMKSFWPKRRSLSGSVVGELLSFPHVASHMLNIHEVVVSTILPWDIT